MSNSQPNWSKFLIWGGAAAVIVFGFVVLPVLLWVLAFRWLHLSRWVLIPACTLGTLGYFLAAWQALQSLSRGAAGARPDLRLLEPLGDRGKPRPGAEAAKAVYEGILEEEEDPDIRAVVQGALDRAERGAGPTKVE
jgi:hypothetical protein